MKAIESVYGTLGVYIPRTISCIITVFSPKDFRKISVEDLPSNCSSPSSDKENSEGASSSSSSTVGSPKKEQINKHLYKYHVQIQEGKIVSSVPAAELKRVNRVPNKDLIKLFIRSHAVRAGTNPNSPWVVEDLLVRKYSLPSKFAELLLSPKKISPTGGLGKRKSLTSTSSPKPSKKAKVSDTKLKKKSNSSNESNKKKSKPTVPSTSIKKFSSPGKSGKKIARSPPKQSSQTIIDISSSSESSSDSECESQPLSALKKKIEEKAIKSGSPTKSNTSSKNSTPKKKTKDLKKKKADAKKDDKKKTKGKSIKLKNDKDEKKTKKKEKNVGRSQNKDSSKRSPKKSPSKSPQKPLRGKKVQVTLFDIAKKKGMKVEERKTPKSPKSPRRPRQALIIIKAEKAKREKDMAKYHKFIVQAARQLTTQQRADIRNPDIQSEVEERYKSRMEKLKWKSMTPEERTKALQQKREERKQKVKEVRQQERNLKKAKAMRYEDQELDNPPLPVPKLVQLPEGLPNTLFGDVTMVVEFISSYSELLMPDDPYPVNAECLVQALASGAQGFGYISRVIVILLQTLLQDAIAEDYKELSVVLSDIPVNMHTASELVRLCLRPHDDEYDSSHDGDSDVDDIKDDDVELELIEKLESSELHELEASDILQILVGLCHRIMSSFSIQDHMQEKQKIASKLWKQRIQSQKKEKVRRLEEKKQKKQGADKPTKNEKEISKTDETNETKQESDEIKDEIKVTKKEPLPPALKKEENEEELPPESNNDLASIVKRRRIMAAREKRLRAEQEIIQKERRQKEYEEQKKLKAEQQHIKAFEEGILSAKLSLRQSPIGTDRNHNRYWVFHHVFPGLFVEKGWVHTSIDYCVQKTDAKNDDNESSNDDENDSDSDKETASIMTNMEEKKISAGKTVPKTGQNLWFQYDSQKELDELIRLLDNNGIRESALCVEIKKKYQDIIKTMNMSKRSSPDLRDINGDQELLESFKEDLLETETRVRKGGLGGVDQYEIWEKKLETAVKIKDLGALLIETQSEVLLKFLQGIMKPRSTKPKEYEAVKDTDEEASTAGDGDPESLISKNVLRWQEAVRECPTMSRLHVLLGILDASIKWEKSAENAKCKICRKKGDEDKLLLCDECNQPFHLYCLRPALSYVPKGDWMCPACKPSVARRNSRGRDYAELNGGSDSDEYDETDSDESEAEHDEMCCMCDDDQELVYCSRCPAAYHRECHDPPLRNFPRGKWVCSACTNCRSSRSTSRRRKALKKKSSGKQTKAKPSRKAASSASTTKTTASDSVSRKRRADTSPDDQTFRSSSRSQRSQNDLKACEDILNKLTRHKDSWPFRKPVEKVEAPDYYDIISDPMDFQTMKNKCLCIEYKSVDAFMEDIKLVFNNAEIYNKTGSEVLQCQESLEEHFAELVEKFLPSYDYERVSPVDLEMQKRIGTSSSTQTHDDHSYVSTSKRRRLDK
ncbi:tyrosine-protein kinase BAZ1B-like [Saccoglossus kowalevskii]